MSERVGWWGAALVLAGGCRTPLAPYRYLIYPPTDPAPEDATQGTPVLLALHGYSVQGDDLERVRTEGLPRLLEEEALRLPFLVVAPQAPEKTRWSPPHLLALLEEVSSDYDVDASRISVTGLSLGGYGAWTLAAYAPQHFAALVPVSGWGEAPEDCALRRLPVWAFHGEADPVVPLEDALVPLEALEACGGAPRLTVYPEAGHNTWDRAYVEDDLWAWLAAQQQR